jgi:hypothetical protein
MHEHLGLAVYVFCIGSAFFLLVKISSCLTLGLRLSISIDIEIINLDRNDHNTPPGDVNGGSATRAFEITKARHLLSQS